MLASRESGSKYNYRRANKAKTHTTGVVLESEAAQTRSPTVSAPLYAHFITYEFTDTTGKKWTNTKKVRRYDKLADVVKGAKVTVFYLPDRPDKNVMT